MKVYKKAKIKGTFEALKNCYALTQMTGAELYRARGCLEGEILFANRAKFDDGAVMKADMLVGGEVEYPTWRILLLSADGKELCDVSENYDDTTPIGRFVATDEEHNTVYCMEVDIERCAIPIKYTAADESVATVFCDSKWLTEWFPANEDNLFRFLTDYTSDESAGLIGEAILADAVLFVMEEADDEPFNFPQNNGWKYRAFADAISEWLDEKYPEASKALDAFLNL